jgi:hypothetical protein
MDKGHLVLSILALATGGLWFHRNHHRAMLIAAEENLTTISKFKANEIAGWRSERIADGNVLSGNELFTRL